MFICGSGSFGHEEEDDVYKSPCRTPKRSRRSMSFCKIKGRDNNNNDKNPYAKIGLDKFYALLAEHDDKKQKIYQEMGSEDISLVRFVYPHDSDRVKPIIVKVNKDKKQENSNSQELVIKTNESDNIKTSPKTISPHDQETGSKDKKLKKKRSLRIKPSLGVIESLKKPYFYLPLLVVLILLFLAIYGRYFAILCTSIGWYMVPTIVGGSSSSSSLTSKSPASDGKLKRKKEYVRKQSEKLKVHVHSQGPSSPKSVINGLSELKH